MVEYVDICVGLAWGDEGKGKIVSHLTKIMIMYVDGMEVIMRVTLYT